MEVLRWVKAQISRAEWWTHKGSQYPVCQLLTARVARQSANACSRFASAFFKVFARPQKVSSRDGLLLRLCTRRLGRKADSHSSDDPHDGRELRVAARSERLIKTLSSHPGSLGDLAHTLRSGNKIEGVTDLGRVAVSEDDTQILRASFRGAKMPGGLPRRCRTSAVCHDQDVLVRYTVYFVNLAARMSAVPPR